MGLALAFKAFIKAFKQPEQAKAFLEELPPKQIDMADLGHLRLLTYLQQSGRLVDFLKEDITSFSDAQIGSAARKIHQDCAQILEDIVTIRPLRQENEGSVIQVPKGYDPAEIKVVGQVKGEPPFSGVLVHRGWKAHKRSLPKKTIDVGIDIICPAEIEIR
jgi:hypothetical protein